MLHFFYLQEEGKHIVTYERNFYTQHLQLQVIAIPASRSDDVKDTFLDFAEENSMAFQTMAEDEDISQVRKQYGLPNPG